MSAPKIKNFHFNKERRPLSIQELRNDQTLNWAHLEAANRHRIIRSSFRGFTRKLIKRTIAKRAILSVKTDGLAEPETQYSELDFSGWFCVNLSGIPIDEPNAFVIARIRQKRTAGNLASRMVSATLATVHLALDDPGNIRSSLACYLGEFRFFKSRYLLSISDFARISVNTINTQTMSSVAEARWPAYRR